MVEEEEEEEDGVGGAGGGRPKPKLVPLGPGTGYLGTNPGGKPTGQCPGTCWAPIKGLDGEDEGMGTFPIGPGCGPGKGPTTCGGIIFNGPLGGNALGGTMCLIPKGSESCVGWLINGLCGGNAGLCTAWVEAWGGKQSPGWGTGNLYGGCCNGRGLVVGTACFWFWLLCCPLPRLCHVLFLPPAKNIYIIAILKGALSRGFCCFRS